MKKFGKHTLTKKYHPDKNSDPDASSLFIEISHAFEALSDPEKRAIYDRYGEEGLNRQEQGGHDPFRNPFDNFQSMFGGRNRDESGHSQITPMDVQLAVTVPLSALYNGESLPIQFERQELCPSCKGSGARSPRDVATCGGCGGTGAVVQRMHFGGAFYQQVQTTCPQCGGAGKKITHVCGKCNGEKVVRAVREIEFPVPKGAPEGSMHTVPHEGHQLPGRTGHLRLVLKADDEDPSGYERVNAADLVYRIKLTLAEALLGFSKTIPTLDGHSIGVARQGVTQPGDVDTQSDEGLPVFGEEGSNGDLYVEYIVEIPEVNSELRQVVESSFKLFNASSAAQVKIEHSEL